MRAHAGLLSGSMSDWINYQQEIMLPVQARFAYNWIGMVVDLNFMYTVEGNEYLVRTKGGKLPASQTPFWNAP